MSQNRVVRWLMFHRSQTQNRNNGQILRPGWCLFILNERSCPDYRMHCSSITWPSILKFGTPQRTRVTQITFFLFLLVFLNIQRYKGKTVVCVKMFSYSVLPLFFVYQAYLSLTLQIQVTRDWGGGGFCTETVWKSGSVNKKVFVHKWKNLQCMPSDLLSLPFPFLSFSILWLIDETLKGDLWMRSLWSWKHQDNVTTGQVKPSTIYKKTDIFSVSRKT